MQVKSIGSCLEQAGHNGFWQGLVMASNKLILRIG